MNKINKVNLTNVKILALVILIGIAKISYSQKTTTNEFKTILLRIDSIIIATNNEAYEKKNVTGKIDSSFGEIKGLVYYIIGSNEIKKVVLHSVCCSEEVSYYCVNGKLTLIVSPHLIYYNDSQSVYSYLNKDFELSRNELQSHFEFYEGLKMLLK